MRERLGAYRLDRVLGEGGMGVVYLAHDDRLDRSVALKTLRLGHDTAEARGRLVREARLLAGVSHPNVCQIFEAGEVEGIVFLAMERLEGEPLSARLTRGPLTVREAGEVALSVLAALTAVHGRGLVHRDIKPSNIFLTPHGVKLVDFGLARQREAGEALTGETALVLTMPGIVVGTPCYMAPEQFSTDAVDARADLFALGVVLYEMLTGRRPFEGRTIPEVWQAMLRDPVPLIAGSAHAAALDRIVERALARRPDERYPTAEAMGADLRAALEGSVAGEIATGRVPRLVVLPLRLLQPDPQIDFLSVSLADAITATLASIDGLVLRSPIAAARFAEGPLDLPALSAALAADLAVTGTLRRAGDRLRVSAQLIELPDGTVLWSDTRQVAMADLFEAEDGIARAIAESLALPLTHREQRRRHGDVPASARAFELYLRGSGLAHEAARWREAYECFEQCLALDPRFAPAWARLGRLQRVRALYGDRGDDTALAWANADASLTRAVELNPELSLAHLQLALLELNLGRTEDALSRLLTRASSRPRDPDLYVGLVQVCRSAGLLEASATAHTVARRLDPRCQTSVLHTWWMLGQYARALDAAEVATDPVRGLVLALVGRPAEASAMLRAEAERFVHPRMQLFVHASLAAVEGTAVEADTLAAVAASTRDSESVFYIGRVLARGGHPAVALEVLGRAVAGGFVCTRVLAEDPWLATLRSDERFVTLLAGATARSRRLARLFVEHGGERLLGTSTPSAAPAPRS
jgi:TolB-like protein